MPTTKIIVSLPGETDYDVRIGSGVMERLGADMRAVPALNAAERIVLISDDNVESMTGRPGSRARASRSGTDKPERGPAF